MFRVRFKNLTSTTSIEHPISSSKCRHSDEPKNDQWILDNGRLVSAKFIETTLTEQDLYIIEKFYTWSGEPEIFDLIIYKKQYLPTAFVKAILKLYKDKTELKDIDGQEVNYLIAKGMLNSAYGMTVTDIVREVLSYDEDDTYHSNYDNMSDDDYVKFLNQQIERYNTNPRRFLFYPWGVWVTAYARRNLFNGILNCGADYVYSDTDSVKILNPNEHLEYFNNYNSLVTTKLELACDYHRIPREAIRPKNKFGKEKPLGVWDFEGIYENFKTLGAKRYLWQKNDGSNEKDWRLTVSGVNKVSGMNYMLKQWSEMGINPFDQFRLTLVIPKEYSGRMILSYIHDETEGDVVDYNGVPYHYHELSSVHMEESQYSMDTVRNFIEYLFTIREERY